MDSLKLLTLTEYSEAKIYLDKIPNEIPKLDNYTCFPGAWYYKVITSKDEWLGIESTLTLPEFVYDEERFDYVSGIDSTKLVKRYKDTPSLYMGGVSDYENDIGFGWFHGLIDGSISNEKITFRPFWRFIYKDEEGKLQNKYLGTNINQTEYYFFPGDKVKMILACESIEHLSFSIKLLEPTKIKKYRDLRNKLNRRTEELYVKDIITPGVGIRFTSFKRVNAIDQYSNEGKPSQITKAYVKEAIWEDTYIYRKIDDKTYKVPLTVNRYLEMKCPNDVLYAKTSIQVIKKDSKEVVIIKPKMAE